MSVTCLSLCLSVHAWKPSLTVDWRLLVKEERNANIGIPLDILGFCRFNVFFYVLKFDRVLGYLQTSGPCIVGELASGGSVAVAVGIGDR